MIAEDTVRAIAEMARRGVSSRVISRELGVSRNTVRRYLRQAPDAVSDQGRREEIRSLMRRLFGTVANGNASIVRRLLAERGIRVSARTVQRAVAPLRDSHRGNPSTIIRESEVSPPPDRADSDAS